MAIREARGHRVKKLTVHDAFTQRDARQQVALHNAQVAAANQARGNHNNPAWLRANERRHDQLSAMAANQRKLLLALAKQQGQQPPPVDPNAVDPNAGGPGYGGGGGGYGGGGGGGINAAAIGQDYRTQLGQVNGITADAAARLKAIQDQYNTAAQQAQQGIVNDTSQLTGQFQGQVGALKNDLAAQGFSASPIGSEATVQQQALADAQLRNTNYLKQLQMAQGANFADRQQQNVLTGMGYQQQLAAQQQAALAGGGGGGGGGRGGRGGGGGYGSSSTGSPTDASIAAGLRLGDQALQGTEDPGADFLAGGNPFSHKQRFLRQAYAALNHGGNVNSLLASTPSRHKRVVAYLKSYRTATKGAKKHNFQERLAARNAARQAWGG